MYLGIRTFDELSQKLKLENQGTWGKVKNVHRQRSGGDHQVVLFNREGETGEPLESLIQNGRELKHYPIPKQQQLQTPDV